MKPIISQQLESEIVGFGDLAFNGSGSRCLGSQQSPSNCCGVAKAVECAAPSLLPRTGGLAHPVVKVHMCNRLGRKAIEVPELGGRCSHHGAFSAVAFV